MTACLRSHIGAFACVLALLGSGCGSPEGVTATSTSAPAIRTPVGPVPGPLENPPRMTNPLGRAPAALTEGRTLFVRMNCSGCHGGHAGGGMGPSLRDVDWIYGSTDAQIFSSIAEGRAHGMPAWGTRLQSDQLWRLVAYIRALRTPDEPQPPV
ncbi:MAG: c-type cytochrome [Vicinamibacterales bacterium]